MTTTEISAVLAVNAAFYRAMRKGDIGAMQRLWTRRRAVSCTHPGGPMIQGRTAVMESWSQILGSGNPLPIRCAEPQAVVTGASALVLCREVIGADAFMATNTFVREVEGWHMLSHQAAEMPKT